MPKLPPFAPETAQPRPNRPWYLIVFYLLFTVPLLLIHLPVLQLPYFWDELGQFIPTALDLLRHGWWVARSTIPNVHPPGLEVYLVLWYKVFGCSIPITRVAMLLLSGVGVLLTFLLSIELSRGVQGFPAFWPPLFLLVSPLFYMQSFMAQLDLPETVLTLLALLLFLKRRWAWTVCACVLLVLVKETGIVTPFVFFIIFLLRRDYRRAFYFAAPAIALGAWLLILHRATGYWLGNPGFAHYNVTYSLNPVRMALSFARRFYYLFFAEFRFIGTLVLIFAARSLRTLKSEAWIITLAVAAANILIVSVLGGAELERYLLPVLPLFYIAVAVAITTLRKWPAVVTILTLMAGLAFSLCWNPPYPFPYENNWAMVDFVRLQQLAADYAEHDLPAGTIATAWPYTAALRNPDFGFVRHKLHTVETNDFHQASIAALPKDSFDILITYTRTWAPRDGLIAIPIVREFLSRFYDWQPDVTTDQCEALGLYPRVNWELRGQQITVYTRNRTSVQVAGAEQ